MSRRKLGIVIASATVFLAVLAFATRQLGGDSSFHARFKSVRPGMPEAEVVALLGPPAESSTQFYLGQREGFEAEYASAAASGSDRFLIWHRGVDVVYAVGLDQANVVTVAHYGGT